MAKHIKEVNGCLRIDCAGNAQKIAAGIVLFNPEDESRLEKALDSVLRQVEQVYVFDNSSDDHYFRPRQGMTYLSEHENKGIAYALNRIMEKAQQDGFEWVVAMDQDSVLPDHMISSYEAQMDTNPEVAVICPQVVDFRRSYMQIVNEPQEEFVEFCPTSGSCTRIDVWEKIGKYDEWLFIDLIDNDFCKRIIASGYKILKLNKLVVDQEFGRIIPKSVRTQKFWNRVAKMFRNDNFGKLGYSKFVNPMRVYYTNRNILYVNKKLKKYGRTGYKENYNCRGYAGFVLCFMIPSIVRAQEKGKVIKATVRGIRDGCATNPEIWRINAGTDEKNLRGNRIVQS